MLSFFIQRQMIHKNTTTTLKTVQIAFFFYCIKQGKIIWEISLRILTLYNHFLTRLIESASKFITLV